MTDELESTPSTEPDDASEAHRGSEPEPPTAEPRRAASEPARARRGGGALDFAMRGVILVGLGVLITSPLWCQGPSGNFQRTEFLADRSAENTVESQLTQEIVAIIRRAVSDQQVDELDATRKISELLRQANLGDGTQRTDAASELVATVLAQAAETSSMGFGQMGENPQMQDQAIQGQARVMARGLITQLGGNLDDEGGEAVEGDWETVSWPTLSGFEYEEGMDLPAPVKALDGKDVMAWGYLLYLEEDQFLLVKSLWSCCFGRPPDLHEAIVVRADESNRRYESRGIRVYGRFEASEMKEEGYVTSLYRLDSRHIRPM